MSKDAHGLTKAEVYAIFGYTTNFFYRDLNYWAREGINADKSRAITGLIDDGLNKLPSWNKQKEVFRGIKIEPPNVQEKIDNILKRYVKNKQLTEAGFTSVSASSDTRFLNHPNTKIKFSMKLKPNSTIKDISGLSDGVFYRNFPKPELLYPTNQKFLVDDIIFDNGVFTIKLIEL